MIFFKNKKKVADSIREEVAKETACVCKGIKISDGETVTYGEARGFFMFRDELYVRADKTSAKKVSDMSVTFIQDIKERFPEEYDVKGVSNQVISKIPVVLAVIDEIRL